MLKDSANIKGTLLLALLLAPLPAEATVVRALSLYEKAQVAPLIVRARVERVEPVLATDAGSVQTLVTIHVLEVLKGNAKNGDRLLLRHSGGTVGDFTHHVPGQSVYEAGEEAILFLEPWGPYLVEIGIGIGKYPIEVQRGLQVVTHDPKVALARIVPGEPMQIEDSVPMEPEPIDRFTKRLRSYVKGFVKPTQSALPSLDPKAPIDTPASR